MQLTSLNATIRQRTRFYRVLLSSVLLLLSLQWLSSAHHDHSYLDTRSECGTCFLAHQLSDDPAPLLPQLAPSALAVSYPLFSESVHAVATRASYLIPHAQAPPSSASSL